MIAIERYVVRSSESPRGLRVFGGLLSDAPRSALVVCVEIPPAGAVRYEREALRVEPSRLDDRFRGTARDDRHVSQCAVAVERADVELGTVPGHVRMIPGDEAEPSTVR